MHGKATQEYHTKGNPVYYSQLLHNIRGDFDYKWDI